MYFQRKYDKSSSTILHQIFICSILFLPWLILLPPIISLMQLIICCPPPIIYYVLFIIWLVTLGAATCFSWLPLNFCGCGLSDGSCNLFTHGYSLISCGCHFILWPSLIISCLLFNYFPNYIIYVPMIKSDAYISSASLGFASLTQTIYALYMISKHTLGVVVRY